MLSMLVFLTGCTTEDPTYFLRIMNGDANHLEYEIDSYSDSIDTISSTKFLEVTSPTYLYTQYGDEYEVVLISEYSTLFFQTDRTIYIMPEIDAEPRLRLVNLMAAPHNDELPDSVLIASVEEEILAAIIYPGVEELDVSVSDDIKLYDRDYYLGKLLLEAEPTTSSNYIVATFGPYDRTWLQDWNGNVYETY